jgi:hypothetical protein
MQYFKKYTHDRNIYSIYNFLEKMILVLLFVKKKITIFHLMYNSEAFL